MSLFSSTLRCRSLKCSRITLHMNLFASFAANNSLWLLWYGVVLADTQVIEGNGVSECVEMCVPVNQSASQKKKNIWIIHHYWLKIKIHSLDVWPSTWSCITSFWPTTRGCCARDFICIRSSCLPSCPRRSWSVASSGWAGVRPPLSFSSTACWEASTAMNWIRFSEYSIPLLLEFNTIQGKKSVDLCCW